MTKKHFVRIANIIRGTVELSEDKDLLRQMALELCDAFKSTNPAFDKDRFMSACGF